MFKINTFIQANGKELDLSNLEKETKEKIKDAGLVLKNVKDVNVYVNMNELKTYTVVHIDDKEITL